jgi:hypothetical protein
MKKKTTDGDELRPEYPREFFQSMKPNRFAGKGTRSVTLDADVAEVFESSESVNAVLRSAIKAMRTAGAKAGKRRAS